MQEFQVGRQPVPCTGCVNRESQVIAGPCPNDACVEELDSTKTVASGPVNL